MELGSVTTLVSSFLLASSLGFIYLAIKYHDRAIGTMHRPDLSSIHELPITGAMIYMFQNRKNGLENNWATFKALGEKPGFTRTLPFIRIVDVSRPDWIEYVQKTNFDNYVKGSLFKKLLGDFLGNGIFVADGDDWFVQRKVTSHIFNVRAFKGVISSAISNEIQALVSAIRSDAQKSNSSNFTSLTYRFTWDSFGTMALSENFSTLSSPSPSAFLLSKSFDFVQSHIEIRFIGSSFYRAIEPFTAAGKKMKESLRLLDDWAFGIIDKRIEEKKMGSGIEEGGARDLLELFMGITYDDGTPLGRKDLRDAILNLFLAGRDTTAQALQWTFFYLCHRAEIVPILREEIERVVGKNGEVNYDNYIKLVKVQAVLLEALRLHPSVPFNFKVCLSDDQIPNGPLMKKGELARWSDWQMARDPGVWGEDCCEFKPWERWVTINEKGEEVLKRYSPWKFHAFNAGPRLCLGQTLATFEAVSVIAALVQNFDISFPEGWWEKQEKSVGFDGFVLPETPMYSGSTTLPMKYNLMVQFRERA